MLVFFLLFAAVPFFLMSRDLMTQGWKVIVNAKLRHYCYATRLNNYQNDQLISKNYTYSLHKAASTTLV